MNARHGVDLIVLALYLVAVAGWGSWFGRRQSSERFMTAGRSLPGWAVGLSIFGSYVSSISFLANPGKALATDWVPLAFALSLPIAALAAQLWFVPFYRRQGAVSAYEHLEDRFGPWARTYAVACYLLVQIARLGTILYLLALALQPMIAGAIGESAGWIVPALIVAFGALVIVYPMFGGSEGVIWTGVVQAAALIAGVVACVGALVGFVATSSPDGWSEAFSAGKFRLGSFAPSLARDTFWVVLANGIVVNLQNFGVDQSYVQRYATAKSDRAAIASVWLGALAYIPISAAFLFIGTALWIWSRASAIDMTGVKPDAVFPRYIASELPVGLTGLTLAAICSAAMDSNLNCCATLYLCDIHLRWMRPRASESERLWTLRLAVVGFGVASVVAGLAMITAKSALDRWWELSGILGGGMLGLFLLGLFAPSVRGRHALFATLVALLVTWWATWSQSTRWIPEPWRNPTHPFCTPVWATGTLLVAGIVAARLAPGPGVESPRRSP